MGGISILFITVPGEGFRERQSLQNGVYRLDVFLHEHPPHLTTRSNSVLPTCLLQGSFKGNRRSCGKPDKALPAIRQNGFTDIRYISRGRNVGSSV